MKSHLAIVGAAGLALVTAGCAARGKPFEPVNAPLNHAIIYVYRPYSYNSSLLHPAVQCGSESVQIRPGAYHAFVVPAGRVTCRVEGETADEVDIDAEPRIYYLQERFAFGVLSGHPQLNPMDTDEAQTEIQSCVQQP
jgi:hypothetical protein